MLPNSQEVVGKLTLMVEQILLFGAVGISCMAAEKVNSRSVVLAPAAHHIVLEVRLGHVQARVHLNLKEVFTRSNICDINPLTVDVMAVRVPAADGDALLAPVVARVSFMDTIGAVEIGRAHV